MINPSNGEWSQAPDHSQARPAKANNPFAQAIFDARDILLPKGRGKGGQRRRVNARAILFTIVTQGEWSETSVGRKNGLWWRTHRMALCNGIGQHQTEKSINWLVSVGLIRRKRQFNGPNILWVDHGRLREIVQRQTDDRIGYQEMILRQQENGSIPEHKEVPEFDPDDLEEVYFTQEDPSEALPEPLPEPHTE